MFQPEHSTATRHEPQITPGKSSLVNHHHKSSYPPIPRQFLQSNINGTQSLKHHQIISRSPYPSISSIQSNHLTSHKQNLDFPINNPSQRTNSTTRSYLPIENPANV
jgi:hypothetical protein